MLVAQSGRKRSDPAGTAALGAPPSPRSVGAVSPPAMASATGLRAFLAKGPGWLRRSPWAPLAAGLCSRGPTWAGQPEPGPRPTSVRQRDGIRSAAGRRAPAGRAGLTWGWAKTAGGAVAGSRAAADPVSCLHSGGSRGRPTSEGPQGHVYRGFLGTVAFGTLQDMAEDLEGESLGSPSTLDFQAQCGLLCWWPHRGCGL